MRHDSCVDFSALEIGCLFVYFPFFLPSLLSSFLILSFLLIYFLTHLLPDFYLLVSE